MPPSTESTNETVYNIPQLQEHTVMDMAFEKQFRETEKSKSVNLSLYWSVLQLIVFMIRLTKFRPGKLKMLSTKRTIKCVLIVMTIVMTGYWFQEVFSRNITNNDQTTFAVNQSEPMVDQTVSPIDQLKPRVDQTSSLIDQSEPTVDPIISTVNRSESKVGQTAPIVKHPEPKDQTPSAVDPPEPTEDDSLFTMYQNERKIEQTETNLGQTESKKEQNKPALPQTANRIEHSEPIVEQIEPMGEITKPYRIQTERPINQTDSDRGTKPGAIIENAQVSSKDNTLIQQIRPLIRLSQEETLIGIQERQSSYSFGDVSSYLERQNIAGRRPIPDTPETPQLPPSEHELPPPADNEVDIHSAL